MANKDFMLDGGLPVTIYKRRGSRNLRLSIAPTGKVRVTIPAWAPYKVGLEFAKARQDWIKAQHKPLEFLINGQAIGKAHHLFFQAEESITRPTSRVSDTTITIKYPPHLDPQGVEVQKVAQSACVRALRDQAERLLPQRLATLAARHNFNFNGVEVKRLKGRWGSCDHKAHIVLNLFLMQLPWELIDYVLLHELTHTRVLRHGPQFWSAMEEILPSVKTARKNLKDYQPVFGQPLAEKLVA